MKPGMTMYSFNSTFQAGRIDVRGFIEFAASVGLHGVDLLAYYWKDERREPEMALELLGSHGLKLHAYAVGNNFVQDSDAELQRQVDLVRRGIEMANRLQAPAMRVFGGHNADWTWDDAFGRICEGFERVLEEAEDAQVVLAIENHGASPGTSEQVLRVLDAFGSPHLRACIDIGNFLGPGQDPVEGTTALAPYAAHVHIKDFKIARSEQGSIAGMEPVKVGAGDVDLLGCLKALKDSGYAGGLAIEAEGPEDDMVAAVDSVDHLKATLERVG